MLSFEGRVDSAAAAKNEESRESARGNGGILKQSDEGSTVINSKTREKLSETRIFGRHRRQQ